MSARSSANQRYRAVIDRSYSAVLSRGLALAALLASILVPYMPLYSYSVLTHEAIIDVVWQDSLVKILQQRFPRATPAQLKTAHAYVYGGSIIQDMGYYPFGAHLFSDLTHYVRSGDFVSAMLRDARDLNEYAFALGALAHYAADNSGHPIGINRAVPVLYPKLQRKFGAEVTYADDPGAHLKTEFGMDVLQVANGRYAADAYHDFIGFEVSKPLLERAFRATYGLELKDVFTALDLAIGSYRRSLSSIIPEMTKVAWDLKKDEIAKSLPGMTRDKFVYTMSRSAYEKEWGKDYRKPGAGTRILAFFLRVLPKVGPLRTLRFQAPTPEAEKMFLESFNATMTRYKTLLAAESARRLQLQNENLDVGEPPKHGAYKIADEAYAKLVEELGEKEGVMPAGLKADIDRFYSTTAAKGRAVARPSPSGVYSGR
jgi:hypothetical protein